jgi:hypothetical protein
MDGDGLFFVFFGCVFCAGFWVGGGLWDLEDYQLVVCVEYSAQ